MDYTQDKTKIIKIIKRVSIGLVAFILVMGSFGTVDSGERGVKTRFNAVVGTLNQGLYFKIPFIEHVEKIDVHTQSLVASKDAPLTAGSNDLQETNLAVVVNYHIDPATVTNIYQQYGGAEIYYSTVVNPLIVATIKATASQYSAAEQIQKRTDMTLKALSALQTAFEGKNVIIEKADITDVAFSPSYTKAIEDKVKAIQEAETAKNNLITNQAIASSTIIAAQAEAEAIKIKAQAINSQGGADYVKLKISEKWDGKGCTSYCGLETSNGLLFNAK